MAQLSSTYCREKPELGIETPAFRCVKLNPELFSWLSDSDSSLIPALLSASLLFASSGWCSPQAMDKLLQTQDLLLNSLTFLSVSELRFLATEFSSRQIYLWAGCLWFHELRWWGWNELEWFSIRYSEGGSVLPLFPHRQLQSRKESFCFSATWEGRLDRGYRHKLSVLLMCFGWSLHLDPVFSWHWRGKEQAFSMATWNFTIDSH